MISLSLRTPESAGTSIFSHHEAAARALLEETPSRCAFCGRRSCHCEHTLTYTSPPDHVLRGVRSFAARSTSSTLPTDTLRAPSESRHNPVNVLSEIDPNNQALRGFGQFRASPTESIKKKNKAESILKQHGSPPGLRVTAGGRIVPSDQSPLCLSLIHI